MPSYLRHRQTIREAQARRHQARELVATSQELAASVQRSLVTARRLTGRVYAGRPPAVPHCAPLRPSFAVAGLITGWTVLDRQLRMGGHTFTVAPGVSISRAAVGAHALVAGHAADKGADIVTRLIVR